MAAPVPPVVAMWGMFIRCKAIGCSWCCTLVSCGKTPHKHSPVPTLVLQFPLLQLSLNLVQHHRQFTKDLLQIVHIVVLQNLGLGVERGYDSG